MNTDHIITNTKTGNFKCEFCGTEESPPLTPAPINVIIDAMDYFTDQHKDCKRPPAEAVMSEYIKGFDAGYSYVINEVEQYIKRQDYDPRATAPLLTLLAYLMVEGKSDTRENT
jgi:hypothetical protein|tara:strand:+ start:5184 stop:5525 length:342 start_codon:yes stop_codon:yes gene_type:complete